MTERQQTIVCAFEKNSPRVSAFEIHEWVYETLRIHEQDIALIQIDGPMRHVYIKFNDPQRLQTLLESTRGHETFRHGNGELSTVRIEAVGLGMRRVRVACLPPEVDDRTLQLSLSKYGDIHEIQPEKWSNIYRYHVSNGVRVARMSLEKHIPSTVSIAGYRAIITYEGQPITCYSCNEQGHIKTECPHRRREKPEIRQSTKPTWAEVANGAPTIHVTHDKDSDTDMADTYNMEVVPPQLPIGDSVHQQDEIRQNDVEQASDKEDGQIIDNITVVADDKLPLDGPRKRHNTRQPQTPKIVPTVGNSDKPIHSPVQTRHSTFATDRATADTEETDDTAMNVRTEGSEDVGNDIQEETNDDVVATSPKRHKKLKTIAPSELPPGKRRSRSKTSGNISQ